MQIRSNEALMLKPKAKKSTVVENGYGQVVGIWKTEILNIRHVAATQP